MNDAVVFILTTTVLIEYLQYEVVIPSVNEGPPWH